MRHFQRLRHRLRTRTHRQINQPQRTRGTFQLHGRWSTTRKLRTSRRGRHTRFRLRRRRKGRLRSQRLRYHNRRRFRLDRMGRLGCPFRWGHCRSRAAFGHNLHPGCWGRIRRLRLVWNRLKFIRCFGFAALHKDLRLWICHDNAQRRVGSADMSRGSRRRLHARVRNHLRLGFRQFGWQICCRYRLGRGTGRKKRGRFRSWRRTCQRRRLGGELGDRPGGWAR